MWADTPALCSRRRRCTFAGFSVPILGEVSIFEGATAAASETSDQCIPRLRRAVRD